MLTNVFSSVGGAVAGIRNAMRRLVEDRRAVAAVEFAIIAPIMLAMYFVTIEIAQGIDGNKKVGRVGSMVADLVTQSSEMNKSELDAIMKIAQAILQPYNRSEPTITITAIEVTPNPNSAVKVFWSRKVVNNVYSRDANTGTATTIPASMNTPGNFLVRVESSLTYKPIIAWNDDQKTTLGLGGAFSKIEMRKTYFLSPRISKTITCADC